MFILQVIGAVLILSFLIFIHELGHFLAAKKNGVKVHEFALGFPPTLFKKKKGETEYKLNLIPFGGYVKLHGEDSFDPKVVKDKKSFASKTPWQKIQILMAGVVMNFLVFWVLASGALMLGSEPYILNMDDLQFAFENEYVDFEYGFVGDSSEEAWTAYNSGEDLLSVAMEGDLLPFTELPAWKVLNVESFWGDYLVDNDLIVGVNNIPLVSEEMFVDQLSEGDTVVLNVWRGDTVVDVVVDYDYSYQVDMVMPDGVAKNAGVENGDLLVRVAGEKVNRGNSVTMVASQFVGESVDYDFVRDGEEFTISMVPSDGGVVGMSLLPRYSNPMIGFGVQEQYFPISIVDFDYDIQFWEAPFVSLQNGWEISKLTAVGFVGTIADAFLKFDISEEVGGPVQVAKMSYEFVGLGGTELMNFVALISLSLAVINILPIPALDGGRILFVVVEALRGKPLNRKIEAYIHALGFFILMAFIFVITIFDLLRL